MTWSDQGQRIHLTQAGARVKGLPGTWQLLSPPSLEGELACAHSHQ